MENFRFFLLALLVVVSYSLWENWQMDYDEKYKETRAAEAAKNNPLAQAPPEIKLADELPAIGQLENSIADAPSAPTMPIVSNEISKGSRVHVVTDVYRAEIDTIGGDLRIVELLKYPVSKDEPDVPLKLLSEELDSFFVAQSGLVSASSSAPNHKTNFQTVSSNYQLAAGLDVLDVPFTWRDATGTKVVKTYRFHRGSYEIDFKQQITNNSNTVWNGQQYVQLQRTGVSEKDKSFFVRTFTGGVVYTEENKYQKYDFGDLADENLKITSKGGWVAMIQHYFLASWIPPAEQQQDYYSKALQNGRFIVGTKTPIAQVQPGETQEFNTRLVVGPKVLKDLETIAPGLELTVDFGILTFIAKPVFWLLNKFHGMVGNWGIAIIMVTMCIKLLFLKLSEKSYRSMARMRKLQPKLESLRERFGEDRQRMNMEIMALYKKEKVSPLGGCLPVLVQIPVFISLYWVLLESVELRQAPFFLWLQDLSVKDPYFVLPLLMGISMFIQQRLNPAPIDPMQAQIMRLFPIIFTIFFSFFPAGLVLYWVVNNSLSIIQQAYITKKIEAAD